MGVLFYIGIIIVFVSLIPLVIINGKMMHKMKELKNMPLKIDEIKASYRQKRFYLLLFQIFGILLAIIGVLY